MKYMYFLNLANINFVLSFFSLHVQVFVQAILIIYQTSQGPLVKSCMGKGAKVGGVIIVNPDRNQYESRLRNCR